MGGRRRFGKDWGEADGLKERGRLRPGSVMEQQETGVGGSALGLGQRKKWKALPPGGVVLERRRKIRNGEVGLLPAPNTRHPQERTGKPRYVPFLHSTSPSPSTALALTAIMMHWWRALRRSRNRSNSITASITASIILVHRVLCILTAVGASIPCPYHVWRPTNTSSALQPNPTPSAQHR